MCALYNSRIMNVAFLFLPTHDATDNVNIILIYTCTLSTTVSADKGYCC